METLIFLIVGILIGLAGGYIYGKRRTWFGLLNDVDQYYIRKSEEYKQWCAGYFQEMEEVYENKTCRANQ